MECMMIAKKAGLGFRGRNSLLISRENGSFNFIAEIITDIEIEADKTIDTNNKETTEKNG